MNQEIYNSFINMVGSGSINDMLVKYYKLFISGDCTVQQYEEKFLGLYGHVTGSLNDRWYSFFKKIGYLGSLNDMKQKWVNRTSYGASLDLIFTAGDYLDPRITFTRSTTATYTDSAGAIATAAINAPRFTYNPVTLAPQGLLIEEQRTNLLTYSEQFDNVIWFKTRSTVTANAMTSPDGTLSGDKLVEDTSNNSHFLYQTAVVSNGAQYTSTIYAKAGERGYLSLFVQGTTAAANTFFNLLNGTVVSTSSNATSSITSAGNGWYRCSVTTTTNSISMVNYWGISADGVNASYTGNGTSGIYIWGAQLEAGAFATSYIPTTIAQVTRTADNASMTGTNFSSWYNASEGALLVNWNSNAPTGTVSTYAGGLTDNIAASTSAQIVFQSRAVASQTRIFQSTAGGGLDDFIILSASLWFGKAAIAYGNSANVTGAFNGAYAGAMPQPIQTTAFNALVVGSIAGNIGYLNGTIKNITYYPRRLSNTELQGLTA